METPEKMIKDRILTVSRRVAFLPPHYPFLRLQGRWLANAGFDIGLKVRVSVRLSCLVITPLEEPAP